MKIKLETFRLEIVSGESVFVVGGKRERKRTKEKKGGWGWLVGK